MWMFCKLDCVFIYQCVNIPPLSMFYGLLVVKNEMNGKKNKTKGKRVIFKDSCLYRHRLGKCARKSLNKLNLFICSLQEKNHIICSLYTKIYQHKFTANALFLSFFLLLHSVFPSTKWIQVNDCETYANNGNIVRYQSSQLLNITHRHAFQNMKP